MARMRRIIDRHPQMTLCSGSGTSTDNDATTSCRRGTEVATEDVDDDVRSPSNQRENRIDTSRRVSVIRPWRTFTTTTTTAKGRSGGAWGVTAGRGSSYYYCTAVGMFLSMAVVLLVSGPQTVSAGFACLSNPCVFGVCIDDLNR